MNTFRVELDDHTSFLSYSELSYYRVSLLALIAPLCLHLPRFPEDMDNRGTFRHSCNSVAFSAQPPSWRQLSNTVTLTV